MLSEFRRFLGGESYSKTKYRRVPPSRAMGDAPGRNSSGCTRLLLHNVSPVDVTLLCALGSKSVTRQHHHELDKGWITHLRLIFRQWITFRLVRNLHPFDTGYSAVDPRLSCLVHGQGWIMARDRGPYLPLVLTRCFPELVSLSSYTQLRSSSINLTHTIVWDDPNWEVLHTIPISPHLEEIENSFHSAEARWESPVCSPSVSNTPIGSSLGWPPRLVGRTGAEGLAPVFAEGDRPPNLGCRKFFGDACGNLNPFYFSIMYQVTYGCTYEEIKRNHAHIMSGTLQPKEIIII